MINYGFSFILFVLLTCSLAGQEVKKDTLFFKLDEQYIIRGTINTARYYLKENIYEGDLSFKEIRTLRDASSKEEICLKKYIRSTDSYAKDKEILDGYKLWTILETYTLFFVTENKGIKTYIEVQPYYEIE